jgi:hypothetical protein
MKISKRSWHFRYLNWLDFPYPHNLCGYFWSVVFIILVTPIFVPLMFGIIWWMDRDSSEHSEPGLLRSWWKAKKDKVCPLITFVD